MTVRLHLFHPAVATRSCAHCRAWQYDEDTGKVMTRGRTGEGLPLRRPDGAKPPCGACAKVPSDAPARSWEHAVEPSERSWRAYQHYRECKATGRFPDDPIVSRNAAIIREIEEHWEREPVLSLLGVLGASLRER